MAIVTDEQGTPDTREPSASPEFRKRTSSSKPATTEANPFAFWVYPAITFYLVALIFVILSSLAPKDPRSSFLSLPSELRRHYSKGRPVKVQIGPNQSPIEVFTIQDGPIMADNVLIVHGLGCSSYSFREVVKFLGSRGVHAVAIDLPGAGFSDKSVIVEGGSWGGVFGRFWDVYSDIMEKGLFWGFDNLIERGYVPYEVNEIHASRRRVTKAIELGPQEMAIALGQVIDSIDLAPVHLVLHDTALGMTAGWVSENSGSVRSLTLIDSSPSVAALPSWILEMPVAREILLGFSVVYLTFLNLCCSKFAGSSAAEAHRVLLKGRDGRQAVVAMGKRLNRSFDLEEWAGLEGVKGIPMQVLWSGNWSKEWSEEGQRVADALPQANFATHSGGRWPQEEVADELAERILQLVSSLPETIRQNEAPEHGESGHHDHRHIHLDANAHAHAYAAGFMDAYGVGEGWER